MIGIGTPSIHNKIPRPINAPCCTQIDFKRYAQLRIPSVRHRTQLVTASVVPNTPQGEPAIDAGHQNPLYACRSARCFDSSAHSSATLRVRRSPDCAGPNALWNRVRASPDETFDLRCHELDRISAELLALTCAQPARC
jgi:hypothetical protein